MRESAVDKVKQQSERRPLPVLGALKGPLGSA